MVRCRDTTVANLPCGAGVWAIGRELERSPRQPGGCGSLAVCIVIWPSPFRTTLPGCLRALLVVAVRVALALAQIPDPAAS